MSKKEAISVDDSHKAIKPKANLGQLSVDIFHNEKEIILLAPVAGATSKDVKISLTKDVLSIQGKRQNPHEVDPDNYYTKECFWGEFARSIVLPLEADTNKIAATFHNNILEIRIPRAKETTKVIKIKA